MHDGEVTMQSTIPPSGAPSSFDLHSMRNAVPESEGIPVNGPLSVNGVPLTTGCSHPSTTIPPIELLPNEILGEIFDILRDLGPGKLPACDSAKKTRSHIMGIKAMGEDVGIAMEVDENVQVARTCMQESTVSQRLSTLDPLLLPLSLAKVSRKFRTVITDQSSHWTQIHITLQRARSPSILSDLLTRSSKRDIDLTVRFPDNRASSGYSFCDEALFRKCWSHLGEHASRFSTIDLEAPNSVLHEITKHLNNRPLALLTSISLSQPRDASPPAPATFFGPFYPSASHFRSFTLNHTSINFGDSGCLASVESISLTRSSGRLLDQRDHIDLSQQPNGPISSSIQNLKRLRVVGTTIGIPYRRLSPQKGANIIVRPPFIPCFTSHHLRHLEISGIGHLSTPYHVDVFLSFLQATYTPLLEALKLEDFTPTGWETVMHFLNTTLLAPVPEDDSGSSTPTSATIANATPLAPQRTIPVYRELHTLVLSGLPRGSLVPFFFQAFPNLRLLGINDGPNASGAGEAYHLFRDPLLCPLLESIVIDGRAIPRPTPVLMITAS